MSTDAEDHEHVGPVAAPASPMEQVCLPRYANAAAAAAVFELFVRLAADNTEAIRASAFKDLSLVIKLLVEHYQKGLSGDEAALLQKCVLIRNKLLHLELSRATGQLVALGEHLRQADVLKVDLVTGDVGRVTGTSTETGRIYFWLWEAAGSGAFDRAVEVMSRGITVLRRLAAEGAAQPGRTSDGREEPLSGVPAGAAGNGEDAE